MIICPCNVLSKDFRDGEISVRFEGISGRMLPRGT
jgi:hypothetical protein